MLVLISPAKSLDYSPQTRVQQSTKPLFMDQAHELANIMQSFSKQELQSLLGISERLAELNQERYQLWKFSSADDAKQALFAFNGDVYEGIDALTLSDAGLEKLQKNLRILSGLYGMLRPFDMILPHRLEMGTALPNAKGKDLYQFWGDSITKVVVDEISAHKHTHIINLASQEYFKSIHRKSLSIPVITPVFKDYRNGKLQMISFFAKKARGLMVRYIAEHDVSTPEHLIGFDYEGYCFNANLSDEKTYVFTR